MGPSTEASAFGKYRLIAELGQGGMADVFLAVQQGPVGFNKLLVIKRLRETFVEDPDFVAMLLDEARLAARLNHPNVVQTNEVGEVGKHHFIAMEYLEGQPLHRIIHRANKTGGLDGTIYLRILADVLAGLHHAHTLKEFDGTLLGVVHRDVSPHNVFVTYSGTVKVVDFGIAKAVGRSAETRTGIVKGKVTYMAPEQAVGGQIDCRADVFAVGVMLWEALTKTRMWGSLPDVVIVSKLVSGDLPPSAKTKNPQVPEELDRICSKALAQDPADRYQTAAEFQSDIEAYLKSTSAHVNATELGALVSGLFKDRRDEFNAIVERQLQRLKSNPADTTLAQLATTVTAQSSPSLSGEMGASSTSKVVVRFDDAADVAASPARSRWTSTVGAALVCVGLGLGAFYGLRSSGGDAAAPTATIAVTLRTRPASAVMRIDGGDPLDNPFVGQLPRDGKSHTLQATAEGYRPKELVFAADHDIALEVALDALPTTPVASAEGPASTGGGVASTSSASAPSPSSTGPAGTGGKRPPRTVGTLAPPPPPTVPPPPTATGKPKRQLDTEIFQ
jgi:serine/threonine protein kinase